MRLIDADALYDKAEAWYKGSQTPFRQIYRSFVDAIADAPTIAPHPNDPLTPEELREMDGMPVWIKSINGWEANPWVWRIEFERCEKTKGD